MTAAGDSGWPEVRARIRALTEGESDPVALMATIACELYHGFERFDWVGFYRVTEPGVLRIGPYQGAHGCLVIPFSRGVCGAAARAGETLVVPDVDAFPDHIACAASTRSEIVVPVRGRDGGLIGVLDIDSDTPDAFDATDRAALEALLAEAFAPPLPAPPPAPARLPFLRRILTESDTLYGPVLLGIHAIVAAIGWTVHQAVDVPGSAPHEVAVALVVVALMMTPVMLILRAYFHAKVRPLPTIFYMFAHAGLIIVGFAGIYGMLEYGAPGGYDPLAAISDVDCAPTWERNLYFSAITFTTVGYGDCAPYGVTRLFTGIQGVTSIIFMGITIGLMTSCAPSGSFQR